MKNSQHIGWSLAVSHSLILIHLKREIYNSILICLSRSYDFGIDMKKKIKCKDYYTIVMRDTSLQFSDILD